MTRPIDLIGHKYGMLTAIENVGSKRGQRMWRCICECGNETIVSAANLHNGYTVSCGCMKGFHLRKHGHSGERLYKIWKGMKNRCRNENDPGYKNYGAKGITVCDEWKEGFNTFMEWALNNGYKDNLSIDRTNVNGNYEPSNCRWATRKTQANNTTRNHYITHDGETKTMKEWSEHYGIPYSTFRSRIAHTNGNIEKALDKTRFRKEKIDGDYTSKTGYLIYMD